MRLVPRAEPEEDERLERTSVHRDFMERRRREEKEVTTAWLTPPSSLLLSLLRPRGSARRWWHCVLTPQRVTAASCRHPPTPRWWGWKWWWAPYEHCVYLSRHALIHSSSTNLGWERVKTSHETTFQIHYRESNIHQHQGLNDTASLRQWFIDSFVTRVLLERGRVAYQK